MKKIIFVLLLIIPMLFSKNSLAQSITIVHTNNGIYLEKGNDYRNFSPQVEYRLGSSAKSILIQSIKKAIEWYDLNQLHKKSFTKEINRFKVMDKETYQFHGYVEQFTKNAKVTFAGYSNGDCVCNIEIDNNSIPFLTLSSKKAMQDFLNILQGKSANPDIDNIFKN